MFCRPYLASVLVAGLAFLPVACSRDNAPTVLAPTPSPTPTAPPSPQPSYSIGSFISGVSAGDGSAGSLRSGAAPQSSGSGPAVQATGNNSAINGGSSQIRVRASVSFQTVYVFVGGVTSGVGGYYEVRLNAPTTDTTIVLNYSRAIPASQFDAVVGAASTAGAPGGYTALQTRVLAASTGEVQVSASWDAASDVDLHVIDPRGEEIYYGNERSRSNGSLDLDSNAGCDIDRKNNENIRWPQGSAPSGTYTVRLDYWSSCGVAATNYVVTINNGGSTQTFRGTFTGNGDQGASGSGRTITTFTHAGNGLVGIDMSAPDPSPSSGPVSPAAAAKLRTGTGSLR